MQYVLSVLQQFTDVQPDFLLFIDASSATSTLRGCNAAAGMFSDFRLPSLSFQKILLFTWHGKSSIFTKQSEHYEDKKCGTHQEAGSAIQKGKT